MTMTTTRREERDVFPPRPSAEQLDSDEPRPLHTRSLDDTLSLAASALGSLALVWVAYEEVLPLSGAVGFWICWYVSFLAMYAGVTALAHPRVVVKDRVATTWVS